MKSQIGRINKALEKKGIQFDKGLTDAEVVEVEKTFEIKFPPDIKSFLQMALPVSDRFVNWRLGLKSKKEYDIIKSRLDWPWEGMLFDIKHNVFWLQKWGEKPKSKNEQIKIARKHFETYPKLIPIYSHRYIPESPNESSNPVFSVYQMDIIYYGANLEDYLVQEFRLTSIKNANEQSYKKINFWSSIVENNV